LRDLSQVRWARRMAALTGLQGLDKVLGVVKGALDGRVIAA
jgi:hypothetical protein